MIITAVAIVAILCIIVILLAFNMFDFRFWIAEKTGLFYPKAQKLDDINDVEQIWEVSLPKGSYIEDHIIKKDYQDMMYIKYKPYVYEARIVIPKEKTEEFIDSVRCLYADITNDGFGNKTEIILPDIMSDFQDIEFSFEFCYFNYIQTDTGLYYTRIPMYKSIFIFEEEDKTTVYLSV